MVGALTSANHTETPMKVARDFTCPRCHADPGHPCHTLRAQAQGRLRPRGNASHKERIALAAAANQAGAR